MMIGGLERRHGMISKVLEICSLDNSLGAAFNYLLDAMQFKYSYCLPPKYCPGICMSKLILLPCPVMYGVGARNETRQGSGIFFYSCLRLKNSL